MRACVEVVEIRPATEGTTATTQSTVHELLRCAAYVTKQKGGQTFNSGDLVEDPVAFKPVALEPSHQVQVAHRHTVNGANECLHR